MSLAASKENAHLYGHWARRLEQDGAMLIGNCLSPVGGSSFLKVVCAASSDLFCVSADLHVTKGSVGTF